MIVQRFNLAKGFGMKLIFSITSGLIVPAQLLGVDKDALKEKLVRYDCSISSFLLHVVRIEEWGKDGR